MRLTTFFRRLVPVTLSASVLVPLAAGAQGLDGVDFNDVPELEDQVREAQVLGLLEAVRSADEDSTSIFLDMHATEGYRAGASLEEHVRTFRSARWRIGNPEVRGERFFDSSPPHRFHALLQDASSGIWWQLDVEGDVGDESRIDGFSYFPITAPRFADVAPIASESLPARIADLLGVTCGRDSFSGAVLVARRDEVLVAEACGEASKTFHVPNTPATRFNIGSINKTFTALAVMRRVEQGRVFLAEPLKTYLGNAWLDEETAAAVTVEHVLSHRSGLGNYLTSAEYRSADNELLTVDAYQPILKRDRAAFTPGDRFRYSNSGMVLAGALIEAVTGSDYYDVIRDEIYAAAGMSSTDSYKFDQVVENVAEPYVFVPEEPARFERSLFHARKGRGTPAGGGYSTVGDMHRFAVALLDHAFISESSLKAMWTDRSGFDSNFYGYGLGFEVRRGANGLIVGHNGSAPGISANFEVFPDSGYVVVVLSNHERAAVPIARRLSDFIASLEEI